MVNVFASSKKKEENNPIEVKQPNKTRNTATSILGRTSNSPSKNKAGRSPTGRRKAKPCPAKRATAEEDH